MIGIIGAMQEEVSALLNNSNVRLMADFILSYSDFFLLNNKYK